jgi:hypothetical protein
MPRWAAKTDANQSAIVRRLRELGCSVTDLSRVGQGCPDILVGLWSVTIPVEIKSETGKLTDDQKKWADSWHGSFVVVRSEDDADALIDAIKSGEFDVRNRRHA